LENEHLEDQEEDRVTLGCTLEK